VGKQLFGISTYITIKVFYTCMYSAFRYEFIKKIWYICSKVQGGNEESQVYFFILVFLVKGDGTISLNIQGTIAF
jgi:hypothetical protein